MHEKFCTENISLSAKICLGNFVKIFMFVFVLNHDCAVRVLQQDCICGTINAISLQQDLLSLTSRPQMLQNESGGAYD